MKLGYQEWRAADALRDAILTFWSVTGDGISVPSPVVLPDAYVEIVINLGDPVTLHGPCFDGRQPARAVVGLLERAIPMRYGRHVRTLGIRLHPARAAGFLGVAANRLTNTVAPLGRLAPACDARVAQWLRGNPHAESALDRAALEALLEEQWRHAPAPDRFVVRAVDRLLSAEDPLTVVRLARELRITPRHLHRKFVATVGTAPKRLERLARFARTWQRATMGPPLGWADLAHANGYADQAHLVREFRSFGAIPPAHLFTREWYEATSVERVGRSDEQVRFIQSHVDTNDPPSMHRAGAPHTPAKRRRST